MRRLCINGEPHAAGIRPCLSGFDPGATAGHSRVRGRRLMRYSRSDFLRDLSASVGEIGVFGSTRSNSAARTGGKGAGRVGLSVLSFVIGSGRDSGGVAACSFAFGNASAAGGSGAILISRSRICLDGSSRFGRATLSEASASLRGTASRSQRSAAMPSRPEPLNRGPPKDAFDSTSGATRIWRIWARSAGVAAIRPERPHHRGDRAAVQNQAEMSRQRKHETIAKRPPRTPGRPDQKRQAHGCQPQHHPGGEIGPQQEEK